MVNTQRDNYTKGTLEAERQHRLQELPGWTWSPHVHRWEDGFSRLLEYVERHGDARVPVSYVAEEYRLGVRVKEQRRNYSRGTINA